MTRSSGTSKNGKMAKIVVSEVPANILRILLAIPGFRRGKTRVKLLILTKSWDLRLNDVMTRSSGTAKNG